MASIVDRHATETGKQGGKRWQVRWRDDRNVQRRKPSPRRPAEHSASQIEHRSHRQLPRPQGRWIPFDEYACVASVSGPAPRIDLPAL